MVLFGVPAALVLAHRGGLFTICHFCPLHKKLCMVIYEQITREGSALGSRMGVGRKA